MNIDFDKLNGLAPVVVQHYATLQVLMVGFMNNEAYQKTVAENKITFFSRSKNRLWTKGETSGNFLLVKQMQIDCDNDTLLIKAEPTGAVCHTGQANCFSENTAKGFLYQLEETIARKIDTNDENSYTNKLFKRGINKVAQKVGEEAVELVIESKDNDMELFKNEAADLLYHFLILLKAKNTSLTEIETVLQERAK
jgi:phosphoribosyl-AMP cyclohydrolase / phosphoribosyl-ATP pyrophosphohydrolase